MQKSQKPRTTRKGFTLLEALVVIAIIAIIASIGLPGLIHMIRRSKIEGAAKETAVLMRKARLEAIRQNVQTAVEINTVTGEIRAFADVHGATPADPPDAQYIPDTLGVLQRGETDYLIGQPYQLPNKVDFLVPAGLLSPEDRSATFDNPAPATPVAARDFALFQPNGSILNTGAIRFGDSRNNFLEVRVDPAASARIEVRKWHPGLSNSTETPSTSWFAPGDDDLPWKWY